jgi:hypothetical protein
LEGGDDGLLERISYICVDIVRTTVDNVKKNGITASTGTKGLEIEMYSVTPVSTCSFLGTQWLLVA